MKITFHGAARTVTGSKHLIETARGKKILLDCGMFQGMGKETQELNSHWGFDPATIDYVIISHAHIDHTGLLPKLVKDGYRNKIYCTEQTLELARLLLLDSAHIQESETEHNNRHLLKHGLEPEKPLYTEDDARNVFPLLQPVNYEQPLDIDEDIRLIYTDCGHILGSAAINLVLKEPQGVVRITFSGDVGRYNDMILKKPEPFPQADYIIIESTYGDRLHDLMTPAADLLLKHITHTCLHKRGNLIIPAFSLGRTQEILFLLNRLSTERRLPLLNYYLDSPLSVAATGIIKNHPECFNDAVRELLKKDEDVFSFDGLHNIVLTDESKSLNDIKQPSVIISASGMAEAGRVKHHIAHNISNPANTILIVGYCEPHSLGGMLKNGARHVNIYGAHYDVQAEVESIGSLSAHGDYEDLEHWLACQDAAQVKKLFIVHGEYEAQVHFREKLLLKGFKDVEIPMQHQTVEML